MTGFLRMPGLSTGPEFSFLLANAVRDDWSIPQVFSFLALLRAEESSQGPVPKRTCPGKQQTGGADPLLFRAVHGPGQALRTKHRVEIIPWGVARNQAFPKAENSPETLRDPETHQEPDTIWDVIA